jgi:hypothetical protein
MSLIGCASDALRGLVIAGGATLIASSLIGVAAHRIVQTALIGWLAMPALVVAYAWAAIPGPVLHQAWAATAVHALVSMLRLAPVGVIIALLAPPPPLSDAALHCLRLGAARHRLGWRWQWWVRGPGRRWLLCVALLLAPAFAEFEIGSRLAIGCWSVRLFDAQAGGQFLSVTLVQALPGCAIQLCALAAAWWLLAARPGSPQAVSRIPAAWVPRIGLILVGLGSIALVAFPIASLMADARSGIAVAITQALSLRAEILASLVFAVTASGCAWLAAGMLTALGLTSVSLRVLVAATLVPGLCGSLVVGLALLSVSQLPGLSGYAAGPLPLVVALVLLLLPIAVVLRLLADQERSGPGWHVMELLNGGGPRRDQAQARLHWSLVGRKRWWALALMFLWAYGDLAASAILHPVDMTPVLVRLYNLMHYGRSTALSVQLAMALCAALLTLGAAYLALRLGLRLRLRLRTAAALRSHAGGHD